MKAVPYTVKAYIQAPNSKGIARIGLHYYNGKLHAVGINLSVPATYWNKKEGLAATRYDQHQQLNSIIRLRCQQLEQAANAAKSYDWQHVKPLFEQLVSTYDENARTTEIKRKAGIAIDIVETAELTIAKAQAEETITTATSKLRELAKRGFVEETEQTKEFDQMLLKYPSKFIVKNSSTKVIQQVNSFIERLRSFSKSEGFPLTFDNMNADFYSAFGIWLMTKGIKPTFNNYFGANIKKLKTFLKWCESNGKQVNPQYKDFTVLGEDKHIEYLTDDELDQLEQFTTNPACNAAWIKYIDFTLVQCLTGLRYSDMIASKWKIENGFLKGTAKKNKGNFKIPLILDERLEPLLNKYPDGFKLFAEQNYNTTIKLITAKLFELHNINQSKIKYSKHQFKKEIPFKDFKHDLLTSHSNRRSFCTRAVKAGFGYEDVLQMIGSKSMVELRKYIKKEDDTLLAKAKLISSNKKG